jgi:hypothetical protein
LLKFSKIIKAQLDNFLSVGMTTRLVASKRITQHTFCDVLTASSPVSSCSAPLSAEVLVDAIHPDTEMEFLRNLLDQAIDRVNVVPRTLIRTLLRRTIGKVCFKHDARVPRRSFSSKS